MEHNPNPAAYSQGAWDYNNQNPVPQQAGQTPATYYVPQQVPEKVPYAEAEQPSFQQQQAHQYAPQQQPGHWQDDGLPHYQQAANYGAGGGGGAPADYPGAGSGNRQRRFCGLTKLAFVGLLAAILAVIAIAVGVGVGVGVNNRNRQGHGQASSSPAMTTSVAASATSTAATTTASVSPATTTQTSGSSSSTSTSATSASAAAPTQTEIPCPAANSTVYTASVGAKTFVRLCGIDYGGNGEAKDVAHVATTSMAECMDKCAALAECTGAGWGVMDGDKGNAHQCWMKKDLVKPHKASTDAWSFAVLQFDG